MTIPDKGTFKRLSAAGLLGNYFRAWDTVQQVRDAGYSGWLTVRARRASDGKLFIPAVHSRGVYFNDGHLLVDTTGKVRVHCPLSAVYLQECPAPDTARIINLEASPGLNGWKAKGKDAQLYVRFHLNDPTNLRHSLQRGRTVRGLIAWQVLRTYLEGDLDQLLDIWDRYPEATIEASRFARRVGMFDSQTIIWEARNF